MGQTPDYNLPYPELSDSPDVPRDMGALALAVENAIKGVVGTLRGSGAFRTLAELTADLNAIKGAGWKGGQTIADLYTKVPTARTVYSSVAVTPASTGKAVIVHNAGFVPSHYQLTCGISSGTVRNLVAMVDNAYAPTTTRFGITVFNSDTGLPWTTSVRVYYTIRD
jgi:hypothetical protein